MTGQMLAPDNYVPMPWSPGGYNRYNYANSNPLKFTDPDGEFWWIVGALIGGFSGWQVGKAVGAKGWGMVGYIIGGAAVGAATGGLGGVVSGALGGGVAAGMAGGAVAGGVGGAMFGGASSNWSMNGILKGAAFGALGGAIGGGLAAGGAFASWGMAGGGAANGFISGFAVGGLQAAVDGGNFWQGALMGGLSGAAIGGAAGALQRLFISEKGFSTNEAKGKNDNTRFESDAEVRNVIQGDTFNDVDRIEKTLKTKILLGDKLTGYRIGNDGSMISTKTGKSYLGITRPKGGWFSSLKSTVNIAPGAKGYGMTFAKMVIYHELVHAYHIYSGLYTDLYDYSERAASDFSAQYLQKYNGHPVHINFYKGYSGDYPSPYGWWNLHNLGIYPGM